jgi:magnesium-transporting ATPase (P-type)
VPGDIVHLASGDRVPADLRLIDIKSLRVMEAALTGESLAVDKQIDPVDEAAALGDRASMAWSGTLVTYGQGTGVVTATGTETELGRISTLLSTVEQLTTPLLKQMSRFGQWLAGGILLLSALLFGFGVWVRDYAASDMFLAAVGLAVAAIPEGLPAIMTITLAIGVTRMAHRHAIIRRLPAVETLGAVSVICSDKTGTLTRNEMTVQIVIDTDASFDVSGSGYAPEGGFSRAGEQVDPESQPLLQDLAHAALLCNDADLRETDDGWQLAGDPTEGALLTLALKAGLNLRETREALPRTDVIPFESEHRFMATLNHDHAGHGYLYLKGAPGARAGTVRHPTRCGRRQYVRSRTLARPHGRGGRPGDAAAGAGYAAQRQRDGTQLRRHRGRRLHAAGGAGSGRSAARGSHQGRRHLSHRRHPGQDDHRRSCRHCAGHWQATGAGRIGSRDDRR